MSNLLKNKLLTSLFMILLILCIGSSLALPQPVIANAPGGPGSPVPSSTVTSSMDYQTDQIIIKYKVTGIGIAQVDPSGTAQLDRLSTAAGESMTYVRAFSSDTHILRLSQKMSSLQLQAIFANLLTLPEVEYAEPDLILQPAMTPNDPLYPDQWGYFAPTSGNYGINAPAAWDVTQGSASIVVAVVDTGITNHAEFTGRTVPGYDFVSEPLMANDGNGRDSDPSDPGDWITSAESASGFFYQCQVTNSSWHGTHVSGTIGAASNNGSGVAGINWNSKILPVRVMGKCGGYFSDIIDGIRWAAGLSVLGVPANPNPAKVINLSLGGPGSCGPTFQNAIDAVTAVGTTVVVAAGNSNQDAVSFTPANCTGVITVAATNRAGNKAWYSNYGSVVEISAPGGETSTVSNGILSTFNTGNHGPVADTYQYYQGTSMAAPHVSGVVSLLYSLKPSLTPAQVLSILQNNVTAFPAGSSCTTSLCGSGIVNAGLAVAPLETPGLLLPENAALLHDPNVIFSWDAVTDGYQYKIQVGPDPGFLNKLVNVKLPPGSPLTYSQSFPGGTYYWRVRAFDQYNGKGAWSETRSFEVNTTPAAPIPLTPGNSTSTGSSVHFSWGSVVNGYQYKLQVSKYPDFSILKVNLKLDPDVLLYDLNGLKENTFYWRVRAINQTGIKSPWSDAWSFTVVPIPPP